MPQYQHHPQPATPGTSRRSLLRQGAALAAGTGSISLLRSVHAAGSDTLRVGLVGCGGRGSGAAVNALNADRGAQIVAPPGITRFL
jgi:hypothetical protein